MKTRSAIHTERILREMERLWASYGGDAEHGVLRACSMTLIAVTSSAGPDDNTAETLAALMREHPSRGIVLRFSPGEEPALDARVRAQCWKPFGRRQQICCELIEIDSTWAGVDDLVPVLRGLLAPDLPVVLWVRGEVPGVEILYPLAAKIVFDAASRGDATSALERLEKAAGPHRRVADLNWGRLTRWRQAVSQMFESPEQRKKLDRISRITVGYRPGDPPVRAYYLAAWFRRALGRDVAFDFSEETASRGTIRSVAVAGAEVKCSVARAGAGESVELRMDDLVSPSIFPPLTDYDLMREELSISGADLVYDEVRRLALELARSDRGRS